MNLSVKFIKYLIIFFSYNKSANNTFRARNKESTQVTSRALHICHARQRGRQASSFTNHNQSSHTETGNETDSARQQSAAAHDTRCVARQAGNPYARVQRAPPPPPPTRTFAWSLTAARAMTAQPAHAGAPHLSLCRPSEEWGVSAAEHEGNNPRMAHGHGRGNGNNCARKVLVQMRQRGGQDRCSGSARGASPQVCKPSCLQSVCLC